MKIVLVSEEGNVLDEIENVDEYDLNKPIARADLAGQVISLVRQNVGEQR